MQIPITKPYFTEAEERAVAEVLRSGWTAQGPKVAEFERRVADYVGAEHAVATTSCTTALHLSLLALGIGPGDKVIIPSFTFIATANAVMYCGAKPVFVDIDPATYNIDPERIEAAITSETKAIIAVDQVGLAADLDAIFAIANKYDVPVIEDAACAIGAEYRGKKVGSRALLCCFSFHPRKIINTGEGGMVTTSNVKLAEKIKKLRHHGMSITDLERHRAKKVLIEEYPVVGYNYRMTDVQAAIGIEQMKKLDTIVDRRRALAKRYTNALGNVKWLEPPCEPKYAKPTYQSYMVRVTESAPITRNQLMDYLLGQGITTRRGIMAVHREAPYRKAAARAVLSETERATDQCIILPLYPQMTEPEQDYVIEKFYEALDAPIISHKEDLVAGPV